MTVLVFPKRCNCTFSSPWFTTKDVGEGTDLGLDIARRIVAGNHKGDIRFLSRPGDTRVQVRLPM